MVDTCQQEFQADRVDMVNDDKGMVHQNVFRNVDPRFVAIFGLAIL